MLTPQGKPLARTSKTLKKSKQGFNKTPKTSGEDTKETLLSLKILESQMHNETSPLSR